MPAHAMVLPATDTGFRAGGLPIRIFAQDVLRRAQATFAPRDLPCSVTPPTSPIPPAAGMSASPSAPPPLMATTMPAPTALERTLRGFSILDLYVEARRVAGEAAAEFEHLEGIAAGRTYGDRSLAGLITPESYRVAAAEAKRRADMAGATADFLRGMLGQEASLDDMLTGAVGG